ncbi:hypothetical protein ACLQ25_26965, partial [Micromonospora sp. DT44]
TSSAPLSTSPISNTDTYRILVEITSLDMSRILADGEEPGYGTIRPVVEAGAFEYLGARKLTRSHVEALEPLADRSWFGRCAVLHDADGNPSEIYFWGSSGD